MDRKSKIFFWLLALLVALSVFATLHRYVVLKDYAVFTSEEEIPAPWDVLNFQK